MCQVLCSEQYAQRETDLTIFKMSNQILYSLLTRLHKSRSSRDELEFDLSNFV